SPFELVIRLDNSEFYAHLKYVRKSKIEAFKFAEAYRASVQSTSCYYKTSPLLKFRFDNTEITFRNNQVFIVTRLPRASIDSLLAQKDAQ
ncbi:MAG TPA: hypothetical protein VNB22_02500, partial [Pyrinomonadaceae bacterium]|nr:hypothetical protein [Pyrinomonadaceae bacterium]